MEDRRMLNRMLDTMKDIHKDIPSLKIKRSDFRHSINKYAVCYLIQNKYFDSFNKFGFPREKYVNRLNLFFDSLQYLLKNFASSEHFDIHVFHEGDITDIHITKILSYSTNNRKIFIHEIVFEIPSHIYTEKVNERIKKAHSFGLKGIRDIGYRHMCSFYSFHVYPLFIKWGYQKLMRLDDDSFLLDKTDSLFSIESDYLYRLNQIEDTKYMLYFEECLDYFCKDNMIPLMEMDTKIIFNNFFIVDLKIYNDADVLKYLKAMYSAGGIYYCRWGDALIQSYIFKLWPQKFLVRQIQFEYQKWGYRFQKEGFCHHTTLSAPFVRIGLILFILIIIIIILLFVYKN